MKIQVIVTPENGEQQIKNVSLSEINISDPYGFMTAVMGKFPINVQQNAIKISCCMYSDKRPPNWYMKTNGKFWADDLEKWRMITGLKSTVSKEFMEEFNKK